MCHHYGNHPSQSLEQKSFSAKIIMESIYCGGVKNISALISSRNSINIIPGIDNQVTS